jgi:hypothetical protein
MVGKDLAVKKIVLTLIALSLSFPASAYPTLGEIWKRPPTATYNSRRSALALEICIGSEFVYPVSVLHGDKVALISYGNTVAGIVMSIRITDEGESRRVEVGSAQVSGPAKRFVEKCI